MKSGRKGRRIRILVFLFTLFSLFFFINTGFSFAADKTEKADFLILEKPTALFILNKYEQKISYQEEKVFTPFSAIRILNNNEILSDNFTTAYKVIIRNDIYYLLTDEDRKLINLSQAGFYNYIKNTNVLNDTVYITKDNRIYLHPPDAKNKNRKYLDSGTSVKRIFTLNKKVYAQILGFDQSYGWSNLEQRQYWQFVKISSSYSESIPSEIRESIRNSINRTNQSITKLFQFFNSETRKNLATPQWQMEVYGDRIICYLSDDNTRTGFKESTHYLINELDNILIGSGLNLEVKMNRIEIIK